MSLGKGLKKSHHHVLLYPPTGVLTGKSHPAVAFPHSPKGLAQRAVPPHRHRSTLSIKETRLADDLRSVVDFFAQNNFQKQEAIHRIIYIVHALSHTFALPSKMKIVFLSIAYNSVEI